MADTTALTGSIARAALAAYREIINRELDSIIYAAESKPLDPLHSCLPPAHHLTVVPLVGETEGYLLLQFTHQDEAYAFVAAATKDAIMDPHRRYELLKEYGLKFANATCAILSGIIRCHPAHPLTTVGIINLVSPGNEMSAQYFDFSLGDNNKPTGIEFRIALYLKQ